MIYFIHYTVCMSRVHCAVFVNFLTMKSKTRFSSFFPLAVTVSEPHVPSLFFSTVSPFPIVCLLPTAHLTLDFF